MTYVVEYWNVGNKPLLGGVIGTRRSSAFSHEADAKDRLHGIIEANESAGRPCSGRVVETSLEPDIVRHCEDATPQARGAFCPRCRVLIQ